MKKYDQAKELKGLYTLAMVNVAIWTLGMVALVFLLENGANVKGMFVILASGVAVGIQIISLLYKVRKNQ